METSLTQSFKKATKGLLYSSESDEPFEVMSWKDQKKMPTAKTVVKFLEYEKGTHVEEINLAVFFKELTEEKRWYGKSEKATAAKYQKLLKLIQENLSQVKVFRLGETEIDVYILGLTKDGEILGLKTMAVET